MYIITMHGHLNISTYINPQDYDDDITLKPFTLEGVNHSLLKNKKIRFRDISFQIRWLKERLKLCHLGPVDQNVVSL